MDIPAVIPSADIVRAVSLTVTAAALAYNELGSYAGKILIVRALYLIVEDLAGVITDRYIILVNCRHCRIRDPAFADVVKTCDYYVLRKLVA